MCHLTSCNNKNHIGKMTEYWLYIAEQISLNNEHAFPGFSWKRNSHWFPLWQFSSCLVGFCFSLYSLTVTPWVGKLFQNNIFCIDLESLVLWPLGESWWCKNTKKIKLESFIITIVVMVYQQKQTPFLKKKMGFVPSKKPPYCLNIAKGTTDPGVDCFDQ